MKFCESQTLKNLAACFAAETQCGAKYQFIRKEAMNQKYFGLAKVLQQLATEEMGHAKRMWDLITQHGGGEKVNKGGKLFEGLENVAITASFPFTAGSLIESIEMRSAEELHQAEVVFKDFGKTASKEGYDEIADFFRMLSKVEATHAKILNEIHTKMKSGSLYAAKTPTKWMCSTCGHTEKMEKAWQNCPLCRAPQGYVQVET